MRKAKYSPIGPIGILEQLHSKELLDNYLLILAHDVLQEQNRYIELIDDWRFKSGVTGSTLIMDNGVIERGSPVKLHELLTAASILEVDIVAAPDMVGNLAGTKLLCMEQCDLINRDYRMMLIPQGDSLMEVCDCIDWMSQNFPPREGIPYFWGVPRWITNKLETRQGVLTYIYKYTPNSEAHLLGMSNKLDDDIECAKHPMVVGIDSANPLVLGLNHRMLSDKYSPHMVRGNYWEQEELTELMQYNVEWIRTVVSEL